MYKRKKLYIIVLLASFLLFAVLVSMFIFVDDIRSIFFERPEKLEDELSSLNGKNDDKLVDEEIEHVLDYPNPIIDDFEKKIDLGIDMPEFFVENGDIWRNQNNGKADRITDIGKVSRLSVSKKNKVAFEVKNTVINIKEIDGILKNTLEAETYIDVGLKNESYVSDIYFLSEDFSTSVLVQRGVSDWGWVPGTELLWYSPSSIRPSYFIPAYDYDYMNDGSVWLFDPAKNEKQEILRMEDFAIVEIDWSPDGKKMMFVDRFTFSMYVFDLEAQSNKKIFNLPMLADGAPVWSIPYFIWAPDSKSIYAFFSPEGVDADDPIARDLSLKRYYFHGIEFFIDDRAPVELMPRVYTGLPWGFPSWKFSLKRADDFYSHPPYVSSDLTKIVYEKSIPHGVRIFLYDFSDRTEHFITDHCNAFNFHSIWIKSPYVYFFQRDFVENQIWRFPEFSFFKVNYKTGVRTSLAEPFGVKPYHRLRNVSFLPDVESIVFDYLGKKYVVGPFGNGLLAQ